ncbi:hypothetical protein G5714_016532 [Onychostoma macrolepis]|uniref:Uncharacterized protein n=1 Tax=Onychostoma macrolepis TaxID=369639 RepID=A0A7J6C8L8_9TELE|nr:hypothetical protein G5714_016532 [Onychostoma macrolepis]
MTPPWPINPSARVSTLAFCSLGSTMGPHPSGSVISLSPLTLWLCQVPPSHRLYLCPRSHWLLLCELIHGLVLGRFAGRIAQGSNGQPRRRMKILDSSTGEAESELAGQKNWSQEQTPAEPRNNNRGTDEDKTG